jgi:hypothetical protein
MQMKTVQCLSRNIVDGKDQWVYAWKDWATVSRWGKNVSKHQHRISWFLSLHAHLRIEETVEDLAHLVFPQFAFKPLLLPYDIVHGIICGYSMRGILNFWTTR